MKKRCAIAALALVAAAAACASNSDDGAITSPEASTTEAPTTRPTTTTPTDTVPDSTPPATTEIAQPPQAVFSLAAGDRVCDWLPPERIAELLAAEFDWAGTATEVDTDETGTGCVWELSGGDWFNTVWVKPSQAASTPYVDFADTTNRSPGALWRGVIGHPVLSDGVVYYFGDFFLPSFGVAEHGFVEVKAAVPGVDDGLDTAEHFAFADAVIRELGWTVAADEGDVSNVEGSWEATSRASVGRHGFVTYELTDGESAGETWATAAAEVVNETDEDLFGVRVNFEFVDANGTLVATEGAGLMVVPAGGSAIAVASTGTDLSDALPITVDMVTLTNPSLERGFDWTRLDVGAGVDVGETDVTGTLTNPTDQTFDHFTIDCLLLADDDTVVGGVGPWIAAPGPAETISWSTLGSLQATGAIAAGATTAECIAIGGED